MRERIPKGALVGAAVLSLPILAFLAYSRPWYFTSSTYIGGLVGFELVFAAIWFYRQVFFPLVIVGFLLAGMNLPTSGAWTAGRWVVLCTGAMVGSFIVLKERRLQFGGFHFVAIFAILAALVSAVASHYPSFSMLKAVSLLLLFLYAATGARLAVAGRENQFFSGLLVGCEVFAVVIAGLYLLGNDVLGNPNSLGAVMGVVAVPILLWGSLIEEKSLAQHRRQALFVLSLYLTYHSHSRAGLAAAFAACAVMCLALRRYKLMGLGIVVMLILVTSSAIFDPEGFSKTVDALTNTVVYKGKDPTLGVLSSRASPWQGAMDSIQKHLWFGSGFGTTDNGQDASRYLDQSGNFASNSNLTSENGSSFLAIVTWVGVLGVLPFLLLIIVLLRCIYRTVMWMWRVGNPAHPAVPLAMVVIAGLVNASLEDWLFAVGYYLCVFFWTMAFVLVDIAPSASLVRHSLPRRSSSIRPAWGVAPN
jgi:O-antigen ligase